MAYVVAEIGLLGFLLNIACCFEVPKHCKWSYSSLVCNKASLTQIPKGIPTSAEYLDFSNNPSLKFEEDYFLRFSKLKILYLNNCSRSRPVLFPNSLKQLYLRYNLLQTTSVITMFKNQSANLTHIDLSHNNLLLKFVVELLPKASLIFLTLESNSMPVIYQHYFHEFIKLRELHLINCGIERISKHSFDSLRFLGYLSLRGNHLARLPVGLFRFLKTLRILELDWNKLSRPPDVRGPLLFQRLSLNRNQIKHVSQYDLFRQNIAFLSFHHNQIHSFDLRHTKYLAIDFSHNNITKLGDFAFQGRKRLFYIKLQNNTISLISPLAFKGISQIGTLYLQRNSILTLPPNVFKNLRISNLFLYGNQIESMNGVLANMNAPPKLLLLISNPPLQEFRINEYVSMANKSSIYLSCNTIKQFSGYGELRASVRCFPSMYFSIYTNEADLSSDGYNCTKTKNDQSFKCTPCPLGYSTNLSCDAWDCCISCPAGSFYQDELALTYCKHCPSGQYVPPERSPGKSPLDCLTCPDGTKKNKTAGYRACSCLDGFARTNRFGKCSKCRQEGISCESHDYPTLQRGYWWIWHRDSPSNTTCKNTLIAFMKNLDTEDDTYDRGTMNFSCTLPKPYHCPIKGSCLGGVNATCKTGYKGILCSVCEKGYSRQFQKCIRCPKTALAVLQLLGYIVLFLLICALVSWTDKIKSDNDDNKRTFADIILSNLKILVGFYQVLVACLNAFSFVSWPNSLKQTIGFFKLVQFEVIRIPSLRCIKPEWNLNAIDEFWIALIGTAILPFLMLLYYAIKKVYLFSTVNLPSELMRQSLLCKKKCMRVLVLFLFVTYPSTSQRIVNVLPLSCHNICTNDKNGRCLHQLSYMRADYSVKCLSSSGANHLTLVFAYIAISIPLGLPVILFLLLWKFTPKNQIEVCGDSIINESRNGIQTENAEHEPDVDNVWIINDESNTNDGCLQFALKFLYENYTISNRYWESLEMLRKLIMTAGITLFIGYGYYKIVMSMTIAVAGFFAILHAYRRPMRNNFENGVQLASLSITSMNVCFALILQSTWYKEYQQKNKDNLAVGLMFVLLNLIVFLLVTLRLMPILYKTVKLLCKASICSCKCISNSPANELTGDTEYVEAVYLLGQD